jgi:hypothetical protein
MGFTRDDLLDSTAIAAVWRMAITLLYRYIESKDMLLGKSLVFRWGHFCYWHFAARPIVPKTDNL